MAEAVETGFQALFVRFQNEYDQIVSSVKEELQEREKQLASERQALETEKESLQREKQQLNNDRERLQREREQFQREREQFQREREQFQRDREEGNVSKVQLHGQEVEGDARGEAPAPAPSVDPSVFASRDIRFFPPTDNVIQLHRQKAESVNRHRTEPPEPDKVVKDMVVVTHVTAPDDFMVHLVRDQSVLTDVMKSLQTVGNSPDMKVNHFIEGKMYSGQFTDDDEWYRVKVNALTVEPPSGIKPPLGSSVLVTYMDFGNSEWLPADRMRLLPEGLVSVPSLAKTCSLADLVPLAKVWSDEAIRLFVEVTSDLRLEMKVCSQTGNVMFVDLLGVGSRAAELGYSQCLTAKDVLLAAGHAVIPGSLKVSSAAEPAAVTASSLSSYVRKKMTLSKGSSLSVILSYVESPDEIYVQLEADQYELSKLMVDIQNEFQGQGNGNMAITDPQQGQPVCCQFSVDKNWYRAEIIDVIGPRSVSVVYVDYGNVEKVSLASVRKLPEPLIYRLPAQAVHCSLVDVVKSWEHGKEWPAEVIQQLSDFTASPQLSMVIKGVPGTVVDVDLLDSSVGSVSQLLLHTLAPAQRDGRSNPPTGALSAGSGEPIASNPATLLVDHPMKPTLQPSQRPLISTELPPNTNPSHDKVWTGVITHIDSPSRFYVHLQGDDVLQDVMSRVANHCMNARCPPESVVWNRGSLCCARFSEDGTWYRAKVLQNLPNNRIGVLYIDFGNSETLSRKELRLLPYECRNAPAQAVKCCIYDVTPIVVDTFTESPVVGGWSRQAISVMNELVGTSLCQIESKTDSSTNSSQPIPVNITVQAPDGQVCSLRDVLIQRGLAQPRYATSTPATSETTTITPRCYSPPRIPDSRRFSALVTCVDKNCFIYAHTSSQDTDEVLLVTDKLQELLAGKTNETLSAEQWGVGQSCCARFAFDNNWYRARIVGCIDERRMEVFYVDFGNNDIVTLDWLHPEVAFQDIPCLSLQMQLHGLNEENYSHAVATKLSELLLDKHCEVHIVGEAKSGNCLLVNVKLLDGQNLLSVLSDLVIQEQHRSHPKEKHVEPKERRYALHYQAPPADSLPIPDKLLSSVNGWQNGVDASIDGEEKHGLVDKEMPVTGNSSDIDAASPMLESSVDAEDFRQPLLPPVGVKFAVQVTHVVTPDTVYLQRLGMQTADEDDTLQEAVIQLERLQHMTEVLNNPSSELRSMAETDITPGMPCSGQYSHDNLWYRAKVVEVFGNPVGSLLIKVKYVDYGTSETVTIDRIRALPLDFHRLPAQALVVNLPGIEPVPPLDTTGPLLPGSRWSVASLKAMAQFVTAKQFVATIQSMEKSYYVYLTDSQGNELTNQLVSAGLARKSP